MKNAENVIMSWQEDYKTLVSFWGILTYLQPSVSSNRVHNKPSVFLDCHKFTPNSESQWCLFCNPICFQVKHISALITSEAAQKEIWLPYLFEKIEHVYLIYCVFIHIQSRKSGPKFFTNIVSVLWAEVKLILWLLNKRFIAFHTSPEWKWRYPVSPFLQPSHYSNNLYLHITASNRDFTRRHLTPDL